MTFSSATEQALDRWISPRTWDSLTHTDAAKFFQFVSQYQKDHGFFMDEGLMRDSIKQAARHTPHGVGMLMGSF